MKKVYYLSTCSTCKRILKELDTKKLEEVDVKKTHITAPDLEFAAEKLGGYEVLFNKRAMKYKSLGLSDKNLREADFKKLILDEYTFLKRPLFIIDNEVFAGNSKKIVAEVKVSLDVE